MKKYSLKALAAWSCLTLGAVSALAGGTSSPATTSSQKKSFSNVMSGTMKSGLPTSTSSSFINRIIYPRAGEFSFYSTRWCGDSDVANYYSSNPQEDYGKGVSSVKLVLGYWVEDASSGSGIPDASNWYSVAYGNLAVNGSAITKLYRSNSNQQQSASSLLFEEYSRLMDLAKYAPAGKSFKLYSAAMICHAYQGSEGADPSKESPTALQISKQLISSPNNLQAQLDRIPAVEKYSRTLTLNVSFSKDQLILDYGSRGAAIQNSFMDSAQYVYGYDYPAGALAATAVGDVTDKKKSNYTVADYRRDVAPLISRISNALSSCSSDATSPSKKYWFEPFGLGISCNALTQGSLSGLKSTLNMDDASADDTQIISLSDFRKAREQAADALLISASLETAQNIVENDSSFNHNKTRCFDAGQRYLNKILASMVFPFQKQTDKKYALASAGGMSLPEPNYALGAASTYYVNSNAVFMNYLGGGRPAVVFSKTLQPTVDFTAPLNFNFHLRDVGCSDGPFFCKLDRDFTQEERH